MLKTNIKSKKELLEKIKEAKVIETELFRYVAERFEQVDPWDQSYEMRYEIKRKTLKDVNDDSIGKYDGWEVVYRESIQDNCLNCDGIF